MLGQTQASNRCSPGRLSRRGARTSVNGRGSTLQRKPIDIGIPTQSRNALELEGLEPVQEIVHRQTCLADD